MKFRKRIGILGAGGSVGSLLVEILKKEGYDVKCGYSLNAKKIENKDSHYFDIENNKEIDIFCEDISILVGVAGPSYKLSKLMYDAAVKKNIPYVDPSGGVLSNSYLQSKIPCVINAGFFPGLSGILLKYLANSSQDKLNNIEISQGGRYYFSKGAMDDFLNSTYNGYEGTLMTTIKNGNVSPAKQLSPDYLCEYIKEYKTFPYITKEVKNISKSLKIENISSYTIVEQKLYDNISKFTSSEKYCAEDNYIKKDDEEVMILLNAISNNENKSIVVTSNMPNYVTSFILYSAVIELIEKSDFNGIYNYSDFMDENYFMNKYKKKFPFKYQEIIKN